MQRRNKTLRPEMECWWIVKFARGQEIYLPSEGMVADVRKLPFDADAFHVALDKGRNTLPILPLLSDTLSQGRWMR